MKSAQDDKLLSANDVINFIFKMAPRLIKRVYTTDFYIIKLKKWTCGRKASTSYWTQLCVKTVSRRKRGCISPTITKQQDTGIQVKNVIWEAVDIPVRHATLTICKRKRMSHLILQTRLYKELKVCQ